MSIGATESTTMTPTGNGLGPTTTTNSDDKQMFLQLLVAQLRYQDPTSPADTSQFLSQNAQFTALEKMQSVADQTGALLGASLAFGASSLVGRSVTYTLDDGTQGTGIVKGVQFGASGPTLDVNGTSVPIANVVTVTDGSGS